MMSAYKKIVLKNVGWALIGKIINLMSGLVVGVIVARYLGPEQYGLMNYVISYTTLFQILASFGLENIEIREEARNKYPILDIIGTAFIIRVACSILTYIAIILTAIIMGTDHTTLIYITIYACSVFFSTFDVIRNYFTSIVLNEYVVKVGIVRCLASLVIKLVLVWLSAPLIYFIASLLLDCAITAEGYIVAYKRKVGELQRWHYNKNLVPFLLKQSFPLLLSAAAATVFLNIDQVMIGNMIDKSSVSYFAIASQLVGILLYIPTIIIQTICPILVKIKEIDSEDYDEKSQHLLNCSLWLGVIAAALFCILSKYIIKYTYGAQYMAAVSILQILSFKVLGTTMNVVSGQLLIIDNKQKYFVIRSLSGCLFCIIMNYLVIPIHGVCGVAWIAVCTQFVAGYLIHAFVPLYRYIFIKQSKAIFIGWKDLKYIGYEFNNLITKLK